MKKAAGSGKCLLLIRLSKEALIGRKHFKRINVSCFSYCKLNIKLAVANSAAEFVHVSLDGLRTFAASDVRCNKIRNLQSSRHWPHFSLPLVSRVLDSRYKFRYVNPLAFCTAHQKGRTQSIPALDQMQFSLLFNRYLIQLFFVT